MTVESLVMASHIHLFNSKSTDEKLARRSSSLYSLNLHILNRMTPPGKESNRALDILVSLQGWGTSSVSDRGKDLAPGSGVEPENIGSGDISRHIQAIPAVKTDSSMAVEPGELSTMLDISLHPESNFDWLDLPLNDQLLFDGAFTDASWNNPCDQDHEYCGITENYF
jgi:hypothetical protein